MTLQSMSSFNAFASLSFPNFSSFSTSSPSFPSSLLTREKRKQQCPQQISFDRRNWQPPPPSTSIPVSTPASTEQVTSEAWLSSYLPISVDDDFEVSLHEREVGENVNTTSISLTHAKSNAQAPAQVQSEDVLKFDASERGGEGGRLGDRESGNDKEEEVEKCVICLGCMHSMRSLCILGPCGHACMCFHCGIALARSTSRQQSSQSLQSSSMCPLCRSTIDTVVRITSPLVRWGEGIDGTREVVVSLEGYGVRS